MILRKFCFIFGLIFSILLSFSSSVFATPSYTYTGSSTLVNDGNGNYRLKFLTSGTFTPANNMMIDAFLVGGGGGGACGGGGGGYTKTIESIVLEANNSYGIVVGEGGDAGQKYSGSTVVAKVGQSTSAFGEIALGGYNGGTTFQSRSGGKGGSGGGGGAGGAGGNNGGNGTTGSGSYSPGAGQGTTTREFNEVSGTLYAGGGGGEGGSGGTGGGGNGTCATGESGVINTGGGGGGTCADNYYGGKGGSGIVVIRFDETIPSVPSYTYTGSRTLINEGNGTYRIKFLTSGTFTPANNMMIDAFLVGGGGGGACGGGGGGYTKTIESIVLEANNSYGIVVGEGGDAGQKYSGSTVVAKVGQSTSAFGEIALGGYNGGTTFQSRSGGNGGSGGGGGGGGAGGSNGSNGTTGSGSYPAGSGQGQITREFNGASGTLYAGGGGGEGGPGGIGGGGNGTCATGESGVINTGGGGGGTCADNYYGGKGGSGIVVIRFDETTPPSGGSISYSATNITTATQTFPITVADGTDDLAGINISSRQLLRQEAVLTNSTCGAYGNATSVSYSGTYPNITTTNFEPNRCYKYQWSVSDNAGNNVVYSSSTVITSSASVIGIKDVALGSFVSINNFNFIKVNATGLLVAANEVISDFTQTFSYTGAVQTFTTPYNGWYQIEAWGAQGGSNVGTEGSIAGNVGGGGGYSSGKLYLNKNEVLYLYIGGQGSHATSINNAASKGFNGGGMAGYESGCGTSCMKGAGGGGGATDIRITSDNLNSRLMIAGGGGGAANWSSPKVGGAGGTLIGANGQEYNAGGYSYTNSTGGTQITGGAGAVGLRSGGAGIFGLGGDADYTTRVYGGGGGGGYYGGGGGSLNSSVVGSGAGGSSFISGYAGVNAITSSSSTTATYTTLHYSGKYFLAGQMQSGVRSGDGQAIITLIPAPTRLNTNLNNVRYLKDCVNGNSTDTTASWVELQAIVNGVNVAKGKTVTGTVAQNASYPYTRIVDGDITTANYAMASANNSQCITIDLGQVYNLDEVGIWHYWGDGRTVYSNTTSASADNSNWVTLISTAESETVNGKRVSAYTKDFLYTGGVQTFTAPFSGTYKLEAWGAAGGSAWTSAGGLGYCSGGAGAYSKGKIYLISGETLYVYVGGKGNNATGGSQLVAAGYNGGGAGGNGGSDDSSGSGGGATDVRLVSGVWNDATSLKSRIMIAAGGGGGSCINASYTDMTYRNGAALINSSISVAAWNQVCAVPEINQKSGYSFGIGRSGWNNTNANTHGLGGGGGGYYGGNGCRNTATEDYWSGGSGGTSFISGHVGCIAITSASDLTPKCATGSDVACASHYSGKVFTNTSITSGVRTGDGYARISFVE